MQTRKEREKGSGERGRGRDGAQAERIPFSPSQNKKSKGNLVQAEEIESYWALPIGSHLDVKRQAAKALSGLANPPQGEEASGTPNAQQQRDLPPSSPQQPRGKLLPDSDHDTKTHTAYMRLHQTPRATRETPLSSLVLAQLTGEPVPRSGLLPPLSVVSRPSRARLLPTTLCSPGLLRMLLSNSASARPPGAVRPVLRQRDTPPELLHAPLPSQGLLCVSCQQRKKTVFAAEQHSLESSVEGWRPKATRHTHATPPATKTAHVQGLARSTSKTPKGLTGTSSPLLATLQHCRLLRNLLMPESLWKWTYHVL